MHPEFSRQLMKDHLTQLRRDARRARRHTA